MQEFREVRAFIQARMSSARFPGKVLAPLAGKPVVQHVVERVAEVLPLDAITVATSTAPSDAPLAAFAEKLGVHVHRGSLDDVFQRFRDGLRAYPCEWVFRVCGDSPLLDSQVLRRLLAEPREDADLVTNVLVRTFPPGHSAELLRVASFERIDPAGLSAEQREHLTKVYYDHPQRFRIRNVDSNDAAQRGMRFTVDTLEDLFRLEAWLSRGPRAGAPVPETTLPGVRE